MPERSDLSTFEISIRDGGLLCEVRIEAGFEPDSTSELLCLNALREDRVEITSSVQQRLGELFVQHAADTKTAHTMIVAQGEAPKHGEAGRLEILLKFDPEHTQSLSSDGDPDAATDAVDFRDCSAFSLAEAGEQIATLHAPVEGIDGRSVTGETLVAKVGNAIKLNIDESVVVDNNGAITAAVAGVVQIDGRKIRVKQELEIFGAVDFSTGNVRFPGDVLIDKGVKDGFSVEATRDITVRGLIEASVVSAGRDLHVLRGAACREKGILSAERDIFARYLNECELDAGRHLDVEKEIINARLAVGGELRGTNCTLIGGSACVAGPCEIAELGSEQNIPTRVMLGTVENALPLDGQARTLLETIDERLKKSKSEHDQFMRNAAKLTASQAEQMTELQFEIGTYERLERTLTGAVSELHGAIEGTTSVDLTVHKVLWQGVTLISPTWEAVIREPIKGPLRITSNLSGNPVLTDLTSDSSVELSTVARVCSRIPDQAADKAIAA